MKKAFIFIAMLGLVSCSTDDAIYTECTESILEEFDMIQYTGQDIGCKFYLELYHYQNQQYFQLGSYCADIASVPVDCSLNEICESSANRNCENFRKNAVLIKIVGIGK